MVERRWPETEESCMSPTTGDAISPLQLTAGAARRHPGKLYQRRHSKEDVLQTKAFRGRPCEAGSGSHTHSYSQKIRGILRIVEIVKIRGCYAAVEQEVGDEASVNSVIPQPSRLSLFAELRYKGRSWRPSVFQKKRKVRVPQKPRQLHGG